MQIRLRKEIEGYSPHNPVIIALKYALENKEALAAQLGCNPDVDIDAFLDKALLIEPERGNA